MNMTRKFIADRLFCEIGWKEQDLWTTVTAYLNDKGWKLSWMKHDEWHLSSWKHIIFSSDTWSGIEFFTYGMVLSTLRITERMQLPPRSKSLKQIVDISYINSSTDSIVEIFNRLIETNQKVFEYEAKIATPGRAKVMYYVYQQELFEPKKARNYKEFAILYKEKLTLEATLKYLSEECIKELKFSARSLKPITLERNERFSVSLIFLFLDLFEQENKSWYKVDDKWYYFEGDQLILSFNDTNDFEAFFVGMAYNYARLPDKWLESHIKGSLRNRSK